MAAYKEPADGVMMNKIVNLSEKCKRLSHKGFLAFLETYVESAETLGPARDRRRLRLREDGHESISSQ